MAHMDLDHPSPDSVPGSRPLDPALRLEAVPYEPDGGAPPHGLLIVFAFVVPAALLLGYASSWVKQYFYIIFLFPLVVGMILGLAGDVGVAVGSVRSRFLAGLAGLFGGFLAMAAMHYFDYAHFQQRVALPKPAGRVARPPDRPAGFFNHLDRKARRGIDVRLRRLQFTLGYALTYIYWIAEVLLAGGLAAVMMAGQASEPFCLTCSRWKEKRTLGTLRMDPDYAKRIFTDGEVVRLADEDYPPGLGEINFIVWSCPTCGPESPVEVKLDHVVKTAKDEEKTTELVHLTYPGQALPVLESLFAPAREPEAGGEDETPD